MSDSIATFTDATVVYDAGHTEFCCAVDASGHVRILNSRFLETHRRAPDQSVPRRIEELFLDTPFTKAGEVVKDALTALPDPRLNLNIGSEAADGSESFQIRLHGFTLDGNRLYLLYIKPTGESARQEMFERALFHDVMNSLASLEGVSQLLAMENSPEEEQQYKDLLQSSVVTIRRQLNYYRSLSEAKQGELRPQLVVCCFDQILNEAIEGIRSWELTREYGILVEGEASRIEGRGDPVLIRQVLDNMLKNAVEASPRAGRVRFNLSVDQDHIIFSVWNAGTLPAEIRSGLFCLGNSTKSSARGVGTYSMKLIGEEVLGGRIDYTSAIETGTTFFFSLPRLA